MGSAGFSPGRSKSSSWGVLALRATSTRLKRAKRPDLAGRRATRVRREVRPPAWAAEAGPDVAEWAPLEVGGCPEGCSALCRKLA
eukprot:13801097-Alexandrium_andersonii.AAC.1